MLKINVQNLCEDLDQLLKDICEYLTEQGNNKYFTEEQRLLANKLIQRSKQQLQQISKVALAVSTETDDQSYVDMNKHPAAETTENQEESDNEYTPLEVCDIPSTSRCPYELSPATDLEKCDKFGNLDRKGRFLFIGHQKRLFVGIKGNWLLVYATKKDSKPIESLNLSLFMAKPVDGAKSKSFELICTHTQKAYQFIAQTPKDMMQWVTYINNKASVREDSHDQNPIASRSDEEDEDNVYETLKASEDNLDTPKKRNPKPLPPLPKVPEDTNVRQPRPETPQQESYDPICPPITASLDQDTDEEQIYDVIQEEKSNRVGVSVHINNSLKTLKLETITQNSSKTNSFTDDDDEERIYDVLEQPTPDKALSRRLKRQISTEEEEEYSNVVLNPSPVVKIFPPKPRIQEMHDESEEEYCSLILNQDNKGKTMLNRSSDGTTNGEEEEAEEDAEYHCVCTPTNTAGKQFVPSVMNIANSLKKLRKEPPALAPKPKPLWRK